jgi:hypothetical protein
VLRQPRTLVFKLFPLAFAALTSLPACSSTDSDAPVPGAGEPPDAPAAADQDGRIERWRSAFADALAPTASFEENGRGAALRTSLVDAQLPSDARGVTALTDRASGVSVAFTRIGAARAPLATSGGVALFAGAGPEAADVLLTASPAGVEDFVAFEHRPAEEALSYSLDVRGAAGLRLVAGGLEVLDAHGAPRLRAAPPEVIDARGRRIAAELRVEGCAYDALEAAPWGRPVVAPGASSCTLRVVWEGRGVRYPALVDPAWTSTTNTMTKPRVQATATTINPSAKASAVLVAGGYDVGGDALATAELYEPLSRTFALTGAMATARGGHAAVGLSLTTKAGVLVSGGLPTQSSTSPLETIEVYDPDTGKFGPVKNAGDDLAFPQNLGRSLHTATLTADNEVLLAGGAIVLNQPTNTAFELVYSPPASSTLTAVSGMPTSRAGHTATRLPNGQILVTGGFVLSQTALKQAELYDSTTDAFQAVAPLGLPGGTNPQQMKELRAFHTATLVPLPDPDPLVAGDEEAVVVIGGGVSSLLAGAQYSNTVELYEHRASVRGFSALVAGTSKRARHSSSPLPTGDLLFVGGINETGPLDAIEMFHVTPAAAANVATTGAFITTDPLPALLAKRHSHIAAAVNAGDDVDGGRTVMVAGGTGLSGPLASGEILIRGLGEACSIDAQCLSGFCVDAVCCNTKCATECFSCLAEDQAPANPGDPADPGPTDGSCRPEKESGPPAGEMIEQGTLYTGELESECNGLTEIHFKCDGFGVKKEAQSFPCLPSACGADKQFCELLCNCNTDAECLAQATPKQCFAKGWCLIPDGATEGECQNKGAPGTPCTIDYQCSANTFCVDNVCCISECKDQCAACNLPSSPGICSPIGTNAPTPVVTGGAANRTPCNGEGTTCSGFCEGSKTDACVYPGDTVPAAAPTCECTVDDCSSGPAVVTEYVCDGDGGQTTKTSNCGATADDPDGGIKCAAAAEGEAQATECLAACAADGDCFTDYFCNKDGGACLPLPDAGRCHESDPTLLRRKGQEPQSCGDYVCQPSAEDFSGACLTACTKKADCSGDLSCNTDGQCVAAPQDVPVTASCSAAPARSSRDLPALAFALAALALAGAQRRAARPTRRARRPGARSDR